MRRAVPLIPVLLAAACGGGPVDNDGTPTGDGLVRGCPAWTEPLAAPGDPISDNYTNFAAPFFQSYCVACHSTMNVGAARNGAPIGRNWDDEASVRMFLTEMRFWVGEINVMPLGSGPRPTCDERRRLVVWIDAGAP